MIRALSAVVGDIMEVKIVSFHIKPHDSVM